MEAQALIRSRGQRVKAGPGAADKSIEGQHGCGSRIEGQAAPGVRGLSVSDVAEVGIDLAGDVAFEAAHDLFLGLCRTFGGG